MKSDIIHNNSISESIEESAISIGYFLVDDDYAIETTKVGDFTDNNKRSGKKIEVWIYSNEGDNIPHMHFATADGRNGCIKLENAEYFLHGSHMVTLSNKEAKSFHNFMKSTNIKYSSKTNYEYACDTWINEKNAIVDLAEIVDMPNYSSLNDNIYYQISIEGKDAFAYLHEIVSENTFNTFTRKYDHVEDLDIPEKYKRISTDRYFKKEGVDIFKKYVLDNIKDITDKKVVIKDHIIKNHKLKNPRYSSPYMIIVE